MLGFNVVWLSSSITSFSSDFIWPWPFNMQLMNRFKAQKTCSYLIKQHWFYKPHHDCLPLIIQVCTGWAFKTYLRVLLLRLQTGITFQLSASTQWSWLSAAHIPYPCHPEFSGFQCERKCWPLRRRSSPVRQGCGSCWSWGWRWPQSWGSAVAWGQPHSGSPLPGRCWCLGRLWVWLLPYPCIAHSPLSIICGQQDNEEILGWFRWNRTFI